MSGQLTTATDLIQLGDAVRARFLKPGDVVERHHGHLFEISLLPIEDREGRLVFSAYNETGGIVAITIHPDLFVQLWTIID